MNLKVIFFAASIIMLAAMFALGQTTDCTNHICLMAVNTSNSQTLGYVGPQQSVGGFLDTPPPIPAGGCYWGQWFYDAGGGMWLQSSYWGEGKFEVYMAYDTCPVS